MTKEEFIKWYEAHIKLPKTYSFDDKVHCWIILSEQGYDNKSKEYYTQKNYLYDETEQKTKLKDALYDILIYRFYQPDAYNYLKYYQEYTGNL